MPSSGGSSRGGISAFPGPVDHSSIGWKLLATDTTTITIAFLFVLIRMYTKIVISRCTGWEDWFCILALATAIGRTVLGWVGVRDFALGQHFITLTPHDLQGFILTVAIDGLLYCLAITLAKLSILFFLYRLFRVNKKFRYTAWIVGFIISVWGLLTLLLSIFGCRPLAATFNVKARLDPHTVCRPEDYNVENVFGFCNILADFALLIMPMPMLWSLHMPTARKIGVGIVFANGLLICAIAILRQYMLYNPPYSDDLSRQMVVIRIWMVVEVNIAITCACLPVIQPLARKLPFLMPFLPSSWASWLSHRSLGRKRTWPKNKLGSDGPQVDVESGDEVRGGRGKMWNELSDRSGSEGSTRGLYHEKLGREERTTPERLDRVSGRFTKEGYGEAV